MCGCCCCCCCLVVVAVGNFEKTQCKSFILGHGRYKIGWKGFSYRKYAGVLYKTYTTHNTHITYAKQMILIKNLLLFYCCWLLLLLNYPIIRHMFFFVSFIRFQRKREKFQWKKVECHLYANKSLLNFDNFR